MLHITRGEVVASVGTVGVKFPDGSSAFNVSYCWFDACHFIQSKMCVRKLSKSIKLLIILFVVTFFLEMVFGQLVD